ncbi:hypothetical protein SEVIR_1G004100v4 [Setaria viridis]
MPRIVNPTPTSSSSSSHRFAKRKLDESVFLGNRLQVTYAPHFESLLDTKEKLEVRRKEVLGRIKSSAGRPEGTSQYSLAQGSSSGNHHQMNFNKREYLKTNHASHIEDPRFSHVPSNKDYFPSESMNATVKLVREKLDKVKTILAVYYLAYDNYADKLKVCSLKNTRYNLVMITPMLQLHPRNQG